MSRLNPSQQQAVAHRQGPALVLAGAGAGKTSVLTQRVAQMLAEQYVHPSRMMVVTFTNKAAREMKERLANLVGWDAVKQISAGTFHSICCRLLRQHIEALGLGYKRNFVIYDPKDQEKTMDRAVRSLNLDPKDYKASQMLQMVGRLKSAGIEPDAVNSGDVEDGLHIRLYRHYQQVLCQNNAMDFDDLLFLTLRLLREQDEVRAKLQQRYEQILVDEYQDTNDVQFELVKQLSGIHRNLFVVGDVDQSIYSFRNANFRIILRFQEDYPDATIIKLEENYRSTARILAAANDLIQHNTERFEKTLRPTRGQGEPLRFVRAPDEQDEATLIVRHIQRIVEQERIPYGDFAILYRTNAMSRIYEQRLIQFAVPYHVVGGFRFYDRREIKDLLGYLNVLHNPDDSLSLKRILNVPKRGLGAKAVEILETSATFEGRGLSLWDAVQTQRVTDQLTSSKARNGLQSLVYLIQSLRNQPLPVSEVIERVFNESGYRQDIEAEEDPKKRQDRRENVEALIQAAIEFENDSKEEKDKTDLGAFLEKIALFSDTDKLKDQNRAVHLMTVHAAKGLEFPVVFLPGTEETIFPHIRSIMSPDPAAAIEEERRLMYVAITRAKNRLFMTYANQRSNKRAKIHNRVSRFAVEIAEHVEIPGELLAEVIEHQRGERLRRMNLKTEKNLNDVQGETLHPMVARMQAKMQGQSTPHPVPGPTSVAEQTSSPSARPAASPAAARVERLQSASQSSVPATDSEAPPWATPAQSDQKDEQRLAALKQRLQARAGQAPQVSKKSVPQTRAASPAAAPAKPVSAPVGLDPANVRPGDKVRHPVLGEGKVHKVVMTLAKVEFSDGIKTLNLTSAPLTPLG